MCRLFTIPVGGLGRSSRASSEPVGAPPKVSRIGIWHSGDPPSLINASPHQNPHTNLINKPPFLSRHMNWHSPQFHFRTGENLPCALSQLEFGRHLRSVVSGDWEVHNVMIRASIGSDKSLIYCAIAFTNPVAIILVSAPITVLMEDQAHLSRVQSR
jgi:hypothetical protein